MKKIFYPDYFRASVRTTLVSMALNASLNIGSWAMSANVLHNKLETFASLKVNYCWKPRKHFTGRKE